MFNKMGGGFIPLRKYLSYVIKGHERYFILGFGFIGTRLFVMKLKKYLRDCWAETQAHESAENLKIVSENESALAGFLKDRPSDPFYILSCLTQNIKLAEQPHGYGRVLEKLFQTQEVRETFEEQGPLKFLDLVWRFTHTKAQKDTLFRMAKEMGVLFCPDKDRAYDLLEQKGRLPYQMALGRLFSEQDPTAPPQSVTPLVLSLPRCISFGGLLRKKFTYARPEKTSELAQEYVLRVVAFQDAFKLSADGYLKHFGWKQKELRQAISEANPPLAWNKRRLDCVLGYECMEAAQALHMTGSFRAAYEAIHRTARPLSDSTKLRIVSAYTR